LISGEYVWLRGINVLFISNLISMLSRSDSSFFVSSPAPYVC
jgi:hypothetical protein